ncbi:hypothetical protein [Roseateles sp. YR242]|uniref:hypothetical protein n=1 Tax=Roseateles sp. YR242 TaxID=1855305 RepID=UPI0011602164|nr:hypothetical protein [Roseateles sp. YR242]
MPPFVAQAQGLYTATAFNPLPAAAGPADPPADWQSFMGDLSAEPESFEDFHRSDRFKQVRDQFLARLQQCEQFARQHFTSTAAATIVNNLAVFRARLLDGEGTPYFGEHLAMLYGVGKRSLDTFCLRLEQADIELRLRKATLDTLADQLQFCRSTGPAFIEAASALDQIEGGLHGQFLAVLKQKVDAFLQRFVRQNNASGAAKWPENMEVHVVNRLKLELMLPGADFHDPLSEGPTLVNGTQLRACVGLLLDKLRPVSIAAHLAEDYHARFLDALSQKLNKPSAAIDPNTAMPEILKVASALGATFSGVSLHSLLAEDPTSGEVRWRSDLALVALDLMRELERLNLVVNQPSVDLMTGGDDPDSRWRLRHIDFRIFHIEEEHLGNSTISNVSTDTVGLRHFMKWQESGHAPLNGLTATAVSAWPVAHLMDFQPGWLGLASHAKTLLRRLGPERAISWIRSHKIDEQALKRLLRGATATGEIKVLQALVERGGPRSAAEWVRLADGPSILAFAVKCGNLTICRYWHDQLQASLGDTATGSLSDAFTTREGKQLAPVALLAGDADMLDLMLSLMIQGRSRNRLDSEALHRLLMMPLQGAMMRGQKAALEVVGRHLTQAARHHGMRGEVLERALGQNLVGAGCVGALIGNHAPCVRWFFDLVIALGREKLLMPSQVALMLAGEGGSPKMRGPTYQAVRRNNADALGTFLARAVDATTDGWIDTECLARLLSCQPPTQPRREYGLWLMLGGAGERCLQAWTDAVLKAREKGCLESDTVAGLLMAPNTSDIPYARGTLKYPFAGFSLTPWLELLTQLAKKGAIERPHVKVLLDARGLGGSSESSPALYAAMNLWTEAPQAPAQYVQLYCDAKRADIIDAKALEDLLSAIHPQDSYATGMVRAIENGRLDAVRTYLHALITQARTRVFEADTLLKLLDGRGVSQGTALFVAAVALEQELLKTVLAATLEATQSGLITGEQWLRLLLPEDDLPNILDGLALRDDASRIDVVRREVNRAHELHLITQAQSQTLHQRLDSVKLGGREPTSIPSVAGS